MRALQTLIWVVTQTWTELNFGRLRPDGSDTSATLNGKRIHGTFFGQSTFGKHALVVESSVTKVPDDTDLVLMSPLGTESILILSSVFY